ncbi:MAG: FG-GAP repeat protein, partial [Thermoanaerobaculia bacterium]
MRTPSRTAASPAARRIALALLVTVVSPLIVSPPAVLAASSVGLSSVRARGIANFELAGDFPEAEEDFGHAFATGDFNGDGVEDLATGIPNDDGVANIEQNIGAVYVQLGVSGVGIAPPGNAFLLDQEVGPDLSLDDEHFGWALASGDFNDDGFADLAVGVPGNRVGGVATGGVQVYY